MEFPFRVEVGKAEQQLPTENGNVCFFECSWFELFKSVLSQRAVKVSYQILT